MVVLAKPAEPDQWGAVVGGGSPWPTIRLVTVGLLLLPGLWRCSLRDLSHLVGRSRGPAKYGPASLGPLWAWG